MATIQPVEIVWLCITGLGFAFSLYNILDAWRTYEAAEELKNGAKPAAQALAKLSIQQEAVRAIQLGGFVTIGLVALTLAPDPQPPETQISGAVITAMFFVVSICLTLNTILQFLGRRKVMTLLPAVSGLTRVAEGLEMLHQDNVDMAAVLKNADGLERLHQDNVDMAEALKEADEVLTRKVKSENGELE